MAIAKKIRRLNIGAGVAIPPSKKEVLQACIEPKLPASPPTQTASNPFSPVIITTIRGEALQGPEFEHLPTEAPKK